MSKPPCAVQECPRLATASRGWCWAHYQRWLKYGDATYTTRRVEMTLLERFHDSYEVVETTGCWEWRRSSDRTGYGQFYDRNRRSIGAYRWGYEQLVGPIPAGLDLDHLCRNRACVNPMHLEPVTRRVNLLRGDTIPAKHAARSTCPRGHKYDYFPPSGGRRCRCCDKALKAANRAFKEPK